jgi:hypothetical protein
MLTYKTETQPVFSVIDWVLSDPQDAAQKALGLIVIGAAIYILAKIFGA